MFAGTYLGLVEKLDYLQALGINAVELLPVQEFNELEYYKVPIIPFIHAHSMNNNSNNNYTIQQMLLVFWTSLVLPGWLVLGVTVGMGHV